MTEEAQIIAIAEFCKWTNCGSFGSDGCFGTPLVGLNGCGSYQRLPSYTTDLNAMHEAEKMLTGDDLRNYEMMISKTSPAKERAEKFLRVIGKWDGV